LRALEQAFEVALVFGGRIQLGLQGVQIFVEMGFDHLELDQVAEGIEQTLIVGQIAALEALTCGAHIAQLDESAQFAAFQPAHAQTGILGDADVLTAVLGERGQQFLLIMNAVKPLDEVPAVHHGFVAHGEAAMFPTEAGHVVHHRGVRVAGRLAVQIMQTVDCGRPAGYADGVMGLGRTTQGFGHRLNHLWIVIIAQRSAPDRAFQTETGPRVHHVAGGNQLVTALDTHIVHRTVERTHGGHLRGLLETTLHLSCGERIQLGRSDLGRGERGDACIGLRHNRTFLLVVTLIVTLGSGMACVLRPFTATAACAQIASWHRRPV